MRILVLGDSHSLVFRRCNRVQKNVRFTLCVVNGATAQGVVNPNSKTDALNHFRETLKGVNPANFDYVMVNLGEVDCGFVMWFRANKHNISIDDQLSLSTTNLFNFVREELLPLFDASKIIINGSVFPVIVDNNNRKFLCGARKAVTASIVERTDLTIRYNQILKTGAAENGYNYMDINKHVVDPTTNTVKPEFRRANAHNHHLSFSATCGFWLTELSNIGH
jgi:hypothetical protein